MVTGTVLVGGAALGVVEASSQSQFGLQLPTKVTVLIFSFLDMLSLLNCMQVCRHWYSQITSERRLWEGWFHIRYGIPPEFLEGVVQACGESVQQAVRSMQRYVSLLIPRRVLGPPQHILAHGHQLNRCSVITNLGSKHILVQMQAPQVRRDGFVVMRRDHTKSLHLTSTYSEWVWNTHFKVIAFSPWADFMVISSLKSRVVQGTTFVSYYWVSMGGAILALAPVPKVPREADRAMCSHCGTVVHVILDPTAIGVQPPVIVVHGGKSIISGPACLSGPLHPIVVDGTEVYLTAAGECGSPGGSCCQLHFLYILGAKECASSEAGASLHLWKYAIPSQDELPEELQLVQISPPIMFDLPFCSSYITANETLLCVMTRSLSTVCLVRLSDLTCSTVQLNVSDDCPKKDPLVFMLPFKKVGAIGCLFSVFEVHEHDGDSLELGLQVVSTHSGKAISFVPKVREPSSGFYLINFDILDGDISAILAGSRSFILSPIIIDTTTYT